MIALEPWRVSVLLLSGTSFEPLVHLWWLQSYKHGSVTQGLVCRWQKAHLQRPDAWQLGHTYRPSGAQPGHTCGVCVNTDHFPSPLKCHLAAATSRGALGGASEAIPGGVLGTRGQGQGVGWLAHGEQAGGLDQLHFREPRGCQGVAAGGRVVVMTSTGPSY